MVDPTEPIGCRDRVFERSRERFQLVVRPPMDVRKVRFEMVYVAALGDPGMHGLVLSDAEFLGDPPDKRDPRIPIRRRGDRSRKLVWIGHDGLAAGLETVRKHARVASVELRAEPSSLERFGGHASGTRASEWIEHELSRLSHQSDEETRQLQWEARGMEGRVRPEFRLKVQERGRPDEVGASLYTLPTLTGRLVDP